LNFKQYVLDNANKKYSDMYDGASKNPIKVDTKLADYSTYDKKRLDYNNRLSQERRDYNNALESIIAVRAARFKREKDIAWQIAERKKNQRYNMKQLFLTTLLLTPAILLTMLGVVVIVNPVPIFKVMNFWILIVLYIVALGASIGGFVYIRKNCDYSDSAFMDRGKSKSILLLLGGIVATVCMTFGMINVGNVTVELSSADDFVLLQNLPAAGRCTFELQNDIDFNGKTPKGWGSIGTFSGTFDGKNHSLKNISIDSLNTKNTNQSIGMVQCNKGTIKNLAIEDSTFEYKFSCSKDRENTNLYLGIFAATQEYDYGRKKSGIIDNCRLLNVNLDVDITTNRDSFGGGAVAYIGGFVGQNSGVITNCEYSVDDNSKYSLSATLKSDKDSREVCLNLGGIVGYDAYGDSSIKNCVVYNLDVSGESAGDYNTTSIGGMIGWTGYKRTYENCVVVARCTGVATRDFDRFGYGGSNDVFQGAFIGEVKDNEPSFSNCVVVVRDEERDFGVSGNMWIDSLPNDVSGVTCLNNETDANVIFANFRSWTQTSKGYRTPCTGFDND